MINAYIVFNENNVIISNYHNLKGMVFHNLGKPIEISGTIYLF